MNTAPIGLGDVFRAIASIAPGEPARWPAIAAALGFELPDDLPPSSNAGPAAAARAPVSPTQVGVGTSATRRESSLPELAPLAEVPLQETPLFVGVEALAVESAEAVVALPPLLPLLAPATAPSILRAAVVMAQPRGPLDLEAVARMLAGRRVPARLPRRRRDAIARDVVVLQDLGEGMDVFAEDAEDLVGALRQTAGRHAVRVGGFVGRPAEPLAELGLHRGTAVVVLTDLGQSPLAAPDERGSERWIELAQMTRRAGARATLLVPWTAERWPKDIASRLAVATWDRGTRVAQVLRAVREHG